ncbi:hypothetical protein V8E53_007082 [Lactarius tabidus]
MAILMPRGRDLALVVDGLADLRSAELSPLLHYRRRWPNRHANLPLASCEPPQEVTPVNLPEFSDKAQSYSKRAAQEEDIMDCGLVINWIDVTSKITECGWDPIINRKEFAVRCHLEDDHIILGTILTKYVVNWACSLSAPPAYPYLSLGHAQKQLVRTPFAFGLVSSLIRCHFFGRDLGGILALEQALLLVYCRRFYPLTAWTCGIWSTPLDVHPQYFSEVVNRLPQQGHSDAGRHMCSGAKSSLGRLSPSESLANFWPRFIELTAPKKFWCVSVLFLDDSYNNGGLAVPFVLVAAWSSRLCWGGVSDSGCIVGARVRLERVDSAVEPAAHRYCSLGSPFWLGLVLLLHRRRRQAPDVAKRRPGLQRRITWPAVRVASVNHRHVLVQPGYTEAEGCWTRRKVVVEISTPKFALRHGV